MKPNHFRDALKMIAMLLLTTAAHAAEPPPNA